MGKEATARIKINKLLEESGWRFFDDKNGKANISLENNVKLTKSMLDEFGEDFEKKSNGFVDFLLLDDRGFPLVVLEAKKEGLNPLVGKEQARKYAKSLNIRFVILSNGNLHYFWDIECGNPYIITKFPTMESLNHSKSFNPNPEALARFEVNDDFVVLTQKPDYIKDASWVDVNRRAGFIKENKLKFLRKYQVRAIKSIQEAVKQGKNRFLFEMATGTGKTLTSAAVIRLFLKSGNAKRVLFLVDRLELENQASKSFTELLKNDYTTVIYKENKEDWKKAEIVVTTVQSLLFNDKYKRFFSPNDFDLIISDEAHRSINGNSRAVFEYFIGYKLGLTATPKDYLKKIESINSKDERDIERRQLLDTYKTFGCETGEPTFRYSLLDGVKEGFLINPIVVDARSEITAELLSEQGYSVLVENEDGKEEEQIFAGRDFEKKFFSEETNRIFCETFMKYAVKDQLSGEIGKTIIFCVSQNHAAKIAQLLNELASKYFPDKYKSDFAMQVTSSVADSQQNTINFSNNNLLGYTNFLEGYKSSKVRVCVTVGMMTTGYDCPDILNLCLMRPVFSPSDFVQMKGRGTRKATFEYTDINKEEFKAEKDRFKLFDFFANCEYFEEKFNYDEVLELPKPRQEGAKTGTGEEETPKPKNYENFDPDKLDKFSEQQIGIEGMKIDRKLYEKFEETVKNNDIVKQKMEEGNFDEAEEYIRKEIFDKPNEYINLEKLRKAIKIDRRISLREILEVIFGKSLGYKSKDELLEDEFEKFITIYRAEIEKYLEEKTESNILKLKNYFKAYATDGEVRDIVEKKQYARFSTNRKVSMGDYKLLNGFRDKIPEYIKDYVSINRFMV